jgi:hypothetical protein
MLECFKRLIPYIDKIYLQETEDRKETGDGWRPEMEETESKDAGVAPHIVVYSGLESSRPLHMPDGWE